MNEISNAQKKQITVWSTERDNLLRDIAILKEDKKTLVALRESQGIDTKALLSFQGDISDLISKKSDLENAVRDLNATIVSLNEQIKEKQKTLGDITGLKNQKSFLLKEIEKLSRQILDTDKEAQKKQYLADIENLGIQRDQLKKAVSDLSASYTDLQRSVDTITGRLTELKKAEKARATLISAEIADLEKKKSALQAEIPLIISTIETLFSKKTVIADSITAFEGVYDKLVKTSGGLEKIVSHVQNVSGENMSQLLKAFEDMKKNVQEIVDINKNNVAEAQKIVSKLPEAIIEMQKPRKIIQPILNKRRLVKNQ